MLSWRKHRFCKLSEPDPFIIWDLVTLLKSLWISESHQYGTKYLGCNSLCFVCWIWVNSGPICIPGLLYSITTCQTRWFFFSQSTLWRGGEGLRIWRVSVCHEHPNKIYEQWSFRGIGEGSGSNKSPGSAVLYFSLNSLVPEPVSLMWEKCHGPIQSKPMIFDATDSTLEADSQNYLYLSLEVIKLFFVNSFVVNYILFGLMLRRSCFLCAQGFGE